MATLFHVTLEEGARCQSPLSLAWLPTPKPVFSLRNDLTAVRPVRGHTVPALGSLPVSWGMCHVRKADNHRSGFQTCCEMEALSSEEKESPWTERGAEM